MHWIIPFASPGPSPADAPPAGGPALPRLAALLAGNAPTYRDDGDARSLSPPHERAFAHAAGWRGADGALPFAARAAQADGIAVGTRAWGLVTPVHWHVGRHHVSLADPAALELTEAESRAAFEAVRPLFESEGFSFVWGAASRWYAAHGVFDGLACASLDRVVGRDVESWMRQGTAAEAAAAARLLRRLQSEVQMLLYPHALNAEREARGALALNSFWLSGCGRAQPVATAASELRIDERLRAPLLADDAAAWAEAWAAIDAGPLTEAAAAAAAGEPVAITLCGERNAHRYEPLTRTWWQRLAGGRRGSDPQGALEAL